MRMEERAGDGACLSAHQRHTSLLPPHLPLQKHPALLKHLLPWLTHIFSCLVRAVLVPSLQVRTVHSTQGSSSGSDEQGLF